MINWFYKLFTYKHNPYIGMFRGWKITKYRATSPDGRFIFWVANSFYGFTDHNTNHEFLKLLNRKERRLVWIALQHDIKQDLHLLDRKAALALLEQQRIVTVEP